MVDNQHPLTPEEQESLRQMLCVGHGAIRWLRRLNRMIPSDPRCKTGREPFGGIGGKLYGRLGFAPSRKNPRFCNR